MRGGQPLRAVTRDGDGFTDAVQALSAAAACAQGTTTWENVFTLRLKECDRISDTRRELETLGLTVSETEDSLSITGAPSLAGDVVVSGHGDHRMIMLLTLLGLRAERPITITGAHHIRKSYPLFFRHLEALGAEFEYLRQTTRRPLNAAALDHGHQLPGQVVNLGGVLALHHHPHQALGAAGAQVDPAPARELHLGGPQRFLDLGIAADGLLVSSRAR